MENQEKIPVLKPALVYGAIVGLATIVVSLLLYFVDQSFEKWAIILGSVVSYGLILLTLVLYRSEYARDILSYGRVVGISLLIGLVAGLLTSIYTFTIYSADESYLQDTKYFAIEKMDERLAKTDAKYQEKMSDDQYEMFENTMNDTRKKAVDKIMKTSPVKFALQSFMSFVFTSLIIGLIAGIFLRRKPAEPKQI
ncbi:MAG: DUF4199 domain-containing protein [Bacteroidales bacterium]|nr:DUF4199 domain-containing protein [Bacteroidales bacterium]